MTECYHCFSTQFILRDFHIFLKRCAANSNYCQQKIFLFFLFPIIKFTQFHVLFWFVLVLHCVGNFHFSVVGWHLVLRLFYIVNFDVHSKYCLLLFFQGVSATVIIVFHSHFASAEIWHRFCVIRHFLYPVTENITVTYHKPTTVVGSLLKTWRSSLHSNGNMVRS